MKRREAREIAFQILFAYGAQSGNGEKPAAGEFYEDHLEELGAEGDDFSRSVFLGAAAYIPEADGLLSAASSGWDVKRMTSVSRALMRLAVYEMKMTSLPCEIAINEALELAKVYDVEAAPAFINGVLNRIADAEGLKKPGEPAPGKPGKREES